MDMELSDTRRGRSVEFRDRDESPMGERWKGGYDDLEDNGNNKSRESKHCSKEKSRNSRREDKDHRGRDREKSKISDASKERDKESKGSVKDLSRDRRKEDGDDREKDRTRDKVREKENDREKYRDKDRGKEKEVGKDGERGQDKEREKEKSRDKERGTDKGKERTREKEREKNKDREKERDTHGDREKTRERERDGGHDKDRSRERDKLSRKQHDEFHDGSKDLGKDGKLKSDSEDGHYGDTGKHGIGSHRDKDATKIHKHEANAEGEHAGSEQSASELQDHIMRMKEERLKKKSKLVGLVNDNDDKKEIRIERTDEYGRTLTPKEAFRLFSHKFHGKGPGKKKQEKRMRRYQEELKVKQMQNSDTPSLSVERIREALSKMKTPYLVLSGHVKPGQTSDTRSGFATMEDSPGSLTPMLGNREVEHFWGRKRKSEPTKEA